LTESRFWREASAAEMPVHNADIGRIFEEIADLLELGDENPFRVRAYRAAALELQRRDVDIAGLIARGEELPKIQGIGADLAAKVTEIVQSGGCRFLEELRARHPPGITQLFKLPGLGPRRVRVLYEELGVASLSDLQRAAREGRIRKLARFGEKSERKILESIEAQLGSQPGRFKRAFAARYAEPYKRYLEAGGDKVVIAGSYRRRAETVGDLDVLVTAKRPKDAIERFVRYSDVAQILARGSTRASVVLKSGLQVDLRVVPARSFGAALHYFTGSKTHNIAIRRLGLKRGLKINEYGVFRGKRHVAGETEESVYAALGLPWIPPERREGEGDLRALAATRKTPSTIHARAAATSPRYSA
jgi:DNA polymerase (family 10)